LRDYNVSQDFLKPFKEPNRVLETDFMNYVSNIDDESPETFVLVHVYNPDILLCRQTNAHLNTLAKKYVDTKFLRIRSDQIRQVMDFDEVAFPALLVYKNKDLIKVLLRMMDDIPEWKKEGVCSTELFEDYLIEHQILQHLPEIIRND
jgi:hypothetical protein